MSKLNIPDSWTEAPIGEILNIVGGATPDSSEKLFFAEPGQGIPWITPADLGRQKSKFISNGAKDITDAGFKSCSTKMLPAGSIIFSSRAPIGHVAIASNALCTNQGFKSIEKNNYFDSDFIFYYLKHKKSYIESLGSGTTFKEVSGAVMKTVPLVIPPLNEQKRISKKIESTQEKIKTIEESVSKAEELIGKYRESLLQKAFRGQLVPQDPKDEPASELLKRIRTERDQATDGKKKKKDELPPISEKEIPFEIPKSWEWVRLGEILEFYNGFSFKQGEWKKSGLPIVRIQNLNKNGGGMFNYYQGEPMPNWSISQGELLFAWSGSKGSSFGAHIWNGGNAVLNQHIFKVLPSNGIEKKFLYWILRQFQRRIEEDAHGFKETFVHVRQSDLKKVLVPLPPTREQKEIVKHLDNMTDTTKGLFEIIVQSHDQLNKMSNSILEYAFSGQLAIQNNSEGTGHALLEKLKLTDSTKGEIPALKAVTLNSKPALSVKKKAKK